MGHPASSILVVIVVKSSNFELDALFRGLGFSLSQG